MWSQDGLVQALADKSASAGIAQCLCGRSSTEQNVIKMINDVSKSKSDKNKLKAENRVAITSEACDGLLLLPL